MGQRVGPASRIKDRDSWETRTHPLRYLNSIQPPRHVDVGYEQAEFGRRFLYESGGLVAIGGFAHLKSSAGQLVECMTRRISSSSSTTRMHTAGLPKKACFSTRCNVVLT
jgi:hypothetical protein